MKKYLFIIISLLFLLSGCAETIEQKDSRLSKEREDYSEAFEDGYISGYNNGVSSALSEIEEEIENLYFENKELCEELNFYKNNAVIVTWEDNLFHLYSCDDLISCEYFIYDLSFAQANGYSPCPYCKPNPNSEFQKFDPYKRLTEITQHPDSKTFDPYESLMETIP